jgi:transposase
MTKTRRDFTPEFKREAVALLESSGRPLMQIATELGTSPSMLRNWRAVVMAPSTKRFYLFFSVFQQGVAHGFSMT